ncbi:7202_t:CDS:1, partial [Racocetra fulgida]
YHPTKSTQKIRSDTNMVNWEVFRKLDQDYIRKAHKLGFNVHRIVTCSNNLGTQISNDNTTMLSVPPEIMVNSSLSSTNSMTSISTMPIWDDNNHWFFMNDGTGTESEPGSTLPYLNS